MEFIPVLIGLFFMLGWTLGILTRQEFATIPNRNIVIWWWLSFAVIFVTEASFWNLLWLMPTIALLNVFTAISIRGFFGFLVGGIPTLILFMLMDL
jgi:hypothetical protein